MAFSRSLLFIIGPTASGKSSYAVEIACARHGLIINADSMQIYKDLRILTARPTESEEQKIAHRLYGFVDGASVFSVAMWQARALAEIETAWENGYLPIVVGGTGLYFRSLTQGLVQLPVIDPDIRRRLRLEREHLGDDVLYKRLQHLDAESARLLNGRDGIRVLRALEVLESSGRPLRLWQQQTQPPKLLQNIPIENHFIDLPRTELYERAEKRFDMMLAAGAIGEVQRLQGRNLDPALSITKAIGFRQLAGFLNGALSFEQAVIDAKKATRHYIKRQLTWWRRQYNQSI